MHIISRLWELWMVLPWWVRSLILVIVGSFTYLYRFYAEHGTEGTMINGFVVGVLTAALGLAFEKVLKIIRT